MVGKFGSHGPQVGNMQTQSTAAAYNSGGMDRLKVSEMNELLRVDLEEEEEDEEEDAGDEVVGETLD